MPTAAGRDDATEAGRHVREAFDRDDLTPLGATYPCRVVVEGNDPRRIDVAVCSRLPIVRVSSWRFWPDAGGRPVFSRDLLQAEIEAADGRSPHVFVNHLKSNFIAGEFALTPGEIQEEREAIVARRTAQADAIRKVLRRLRLTTRVVVCGDFNDDPDAPTLTALADYGLAERIGQATTVPGPNRSGVLVADKFAGLSAAMWTHRYRAKGQASFACYDRIWISPDPPATAAHVMRRTQITGDGCDHDPAVIDLGL